MLSRIIKVIILIGLVGVIAYGGLCVYSNFIDKPNTGVPDMPKSEEAAYSLTVENTGKLIMTNDYEVLGSVVGKRVFILHGWWEFLGQDFKFKSGDIVLDEAVFGKITLKKR